MLGVVSGASYVDRTDRKGGRMIRAYTFLLRPTVGRTIALGEMLADHRSLYDGALQERRDAYRHGSKTSVKSAQLKDIRAYDPDHQGRWSFSSQQATLRRLTPDGGCS
ncbi:hypothetical protein [Streptomyces atratus]|uniref:hypothetical protein n=1 Tax=Streptomyces atratus TaxID=1893 RepID=UPI003F54192B